MVERKTLNLVVVGSSPTEGAYFFIIVSIFGGIWFLLIYQKEVNYKAALFFLNRSCSSEYNVSSSSVTQIKKVVRCVFWFSFQR